MKETKVEAKTIQDAIETGLIELSLRRDQVEVTVLQEPTSGFLGIGAKKACVLLREKRWGAEREGRGSRDRGGYGGGRGEGRRERGGRGGRGEGRRERGGYGGGRGEGRRDDRPRREDRQPREHVPSGPETVLENVTVPEPPQDPVEHAKAALSQTVSLMGLGVTVTEARLDEAAGRIIMRFDSPESALFTEDNGHGLQALQFLVSSMLNKSRKNRYSVQVDTGEFWARKEAELVGRVEEAVKAVQSTGKPYRLDPMSSQMRKLVHDLIKARFPEVETISEGEGKWRKVVVRPASRNEEPAQVAAAPQPAPQEPAPAPETSGEAAPGGPEEPR